MNNSQVVHSRGIIIVASLVSSLVMLDTNVVAVALPTIANSFGADFADMQWVVTAYMLPFAALLLAAGAFGDLFGRRKSMLLGLSIFAAASLLCGVAISPLMLNISRAIQGIGASLLLTAALAIINHSFRGLERAKAYAFWGASLGVAITSGPIIGGVISSVFGWHWAFLINLPICIALIVATTKVIQESSDPESKHLDYAGITTFSSGLFLLIWAVIDGNGLGWMSQSILLRIIGGLVFLAIFMFVENKQVRPMVDFSLFKSRNFVGSSFAMLGYAGGAQVMLFYLPLYLQNAYGYAPAIAGLAMLPFALPMFVVPRVGVRLTKDFQARSILCIGLGISTFANLSMAFLADNGASYIYFAVAMIIAGAGAGLLNGETAKTMQGAVPPQRAGMASGISGTMRFCGLLFGVAGLGAVLISIASSKFMLSASTWGLAQDVNLDLAKRFASGDVLGVAQVLAIDIRQPVMLALRNAFEQGFGAASLTAAGVAFIALVATRLLIPNAKADYLEDGIGESLIAPSE